jgi:hypothetical protein
MADGVNDNGNDNGKPFRPKPQASSGLYIRGANGRRIRDQAVRRLARKAKLCMPFLQEADHATLRGWCELEILCGRAYAVLREVGIVGRDGSPLRLLSDYRLLRTCQLGFARELGMTPLARAQLKLRTDGSAFDLAAALASGDGVKDEAEVAGAAADGEQG